MPSKKSYNILVYTFLFFIIITKPVYSQYCHSSTTDIEHEWISRVQFNNIDKSSGSTTYSNFTDVSTFVENGTSYSITINVSLTGGWEECVRVWIDWDQDETFNTDTEQYNIDCKILSSPWEILSNTINVPESAKLGNTRMRVSLKYNEYPTPCETFENGEVEDYTIEVTSTVPTTTTTTTIGSTTSTTTSGTTTTTTTLISLSCDEEEVYVKQKNKCTVDGCDKGYWLITNYDNNPLVENKISEIPPNEIEFLPTVEEGKVFTAAVCLDPYITKNIITNVIKGPIMICPDSCYVDENCECEVNECEEGVFLLDNQENEPLESEIVYEFDNVSFSYGFQPKEEGVIKVTMICRRPYSTEQELIVNVTYPVTTTTIPEELEMTDVDCNKENCVIDIDENTIKETTKIFVKLIKEPLGEVYYSGTLNVNPNSTGSKVVELSEFKSCPSDTELKVLTMAYPESNLNNRLYRNKGDFTC